MPDAASPPRDAARPISPGFWCSRVWLLAVPADFNIAEFTRSRGGGRVYMPKAGSGQEGGCKPRARDARWRRQEQSNGDGHGAVGVGLGKRSPKTFCCRSVTRPEARRYVNAVAVSETADAQTRRYKVENAVWKTVHNCGSAGEGHRQTGELQRRSSIISAGEGAEGSMIEQGISVRQGRMPISTISARECGKNVLLHHCRVQSA